MKIKLLGILVFIVILINYKIILSTNSIFGGDYIHFGKSGLTYLLHNSFQVWDSHLNLGWNRVALMGYAPINTIIGLIALLFRYNAPLVERIVWWLPFLILSFFSTIKLSHYLSLSKKIYPLSLLLFLVNTYILMIISGGQIAGIGLAYSMLPLSSYYFIRLTDELKDNKKRILSKSLVAGLILSLQLMLDMRIFYIGILLIFFYSLVSILTGGNFAYKKIAKVVVYTFLIPLLITFAIHSYWIIPLLIFKVSPLQNGGVGFTTASAISFFSFAKLENTLGLLHPNWPENIFGKVGFMKPEFLVLPLLAFGSLFFVENEKKEKRKYLVFFVLIGLLGGFLAKGVNEPFGEIYLWMFNNVPGFNMFRDPTKWYVLIVISYSVLIPFTIWKIHELLSAKKNFLTKSPIFNLCNGLVLLTVGYLAFLIYPSLSGNITGTFKGTFVPNEYRSLERYFLSQEKYSRTLWVPTLQRFGYNSDNHPAVLAQDFFQEVNSTKIINSLASSESLLRESAIKYVIIPFDSEGEIFLNDRRYEETIYNDYIRKVEQIKWLKKIEGFGKISVFEITNPADHFWSSKEDLVKSYKYISPTMYSISIQNAKKGDSIVFAENFDKNWEARIGENNKIESVRFENRFNAFNLLEEGDYDIKIYYKPQNWVGLGLAIGGFTILLFVIYFSILLMKR